MKSFLDFHKPVFEFRNSTVIRNRKFGALGDRIESKLVAELFYPTPGHLHNVQIRVELPQGLTAERVKIAISKTKQPRLMKSDRSLKSEKFTTHFGGILLKRTFDIKRRSYLYLSVTVAKKDQFKQYRIQFIRNDTILAEFWRTSHGAQKVTKLII